MTWTAVAILAAGIVIGAGIKFGYLRIHGVHVVVPYIERTDRAFTVGVIAVTVMSLVTIVQTSASAAENESCAKQFRDALTYNSSVNTQTAEIAAERNTEFDRLLGAIVGNAGKPGEVSRAENAKAITDYRSKTAQLDAERTNALKSRTPYPDPTCGRDT